MEEIVKRRSISDARISFVSLVSKAANKKTFLITKSSDGRAEFSTRGRIIKTDRKNHYVTGIVYEPLVEDSQGDYMTADEIKKAAVWFMKNGKGIDLQHNFEKLGGAAVVESMVMKSDCVIGKEKVRSGTWVMTVEVSDPDVWAAIEKGEITGFSMGGEGVCRVEDSPETLSKSERRSLIRKLAELLRIEKGDFADSYSKKEHQKNISESFWDAFYTLQETLLTRDGNGIPSFETDPEKVRECLSEFSDVVEGLLIGGNVKGVAKAGRAISGRNLERLKAIYESIGNLLSEAGETEEEMTKSEAMAFIKEQIDLLDKPKEETDTKPSDGLDEETKKFIVETIKQLLGEQNREESVTKEEVGKMMKQALEPVFKARGIATNLGEGEEPISKETDVFDGLFM